MIAVNYLVWGVVFASGDKSQTQRETEASERKKTADASPLLLLVTVMQCDEKKSEMS